MIQHRPTNGMGYSIDLDHTISLENMSIIVDHLEWLKTKKIAILIHIYYLEIYREIYDRLSDLKFEFDLYISIPAGSLCESDQIRQAFSIYNPVIILCDNKGKDIGGKLSIMMYIHKHNLKYDYLILSHDKKNYPRFGPNWRINLLTEIFSDNNINKIINGFSSYPQIKLSGGHIREGFIDTLWIQDERLTHLTFDHGNLTNIADIMNKMNLPIPLSGAFIGGTMFWMDWKYFATLLNPTVIDYILSKLQYGDVRDPSYAHAMERVFGLMVTVNNYKIGKVMHDSGKLIW